MADTGNGEQMDIEVIDLTYDEAEDLILPAEANRHAEALRGIALYIDSIGESLRGIASSTSNAAIGKLALDVVKLSREVSTAASRLTVYQSMAALITHTMRLAIGDEGTPLHMVAFAPMAQRYQLWKDRLVQALRTCMGTAEAISKQLIDASNASATDATNLSQLHQIIAGQIEMLDFQPMSPDMAQVLVEFGELQSTVEAFAFDVKAINNYNNAVDIAFPLSAYAKKNRRLHYLSMVYWRYLERRRGPLIAAVLNFKTHMQYLETMLETNRTQFASQEEVIFQGCLKSEITHFILMIKEWEGMTRQHIKHDFRSYHDTQFPAIGSDKDKDSLIKHLRDVDRFVLGGITLLNEEIEKDFSSVKIPGGYDYGRLTYKTFCDLSGFFALMLFEYKLFRELTLPLDLHDPELVAKWYAYPARAALDTSGVDWAMDEIRTNLLKYPTQHPTLKYPVQLQ